VAAASVSTIAKPSEAVFDILNIAPEEADGEVRLPARCAALRLRRPHGGHGPWPGSLVMLMCGAQSIRDVIAFPKTQTAALPHDRRRRAT
jgi:aspartyl-tRNA synthetase